ncbi:PREDICTED: uncharacterized protein LOC109147966 [Ipomoea nil]|uniref:uncharacterized protein LOC109147966 n=1 Tax=Ipomoea nil TaxID=35883 RepID=UPI0009016FAE|nr:PREDICTED: uncharacterized protein LOC109147966 [Ipomoea nil]XP_019151199.1 PREDICTED: uncharacterized protein LOC109147966 [Ipomoea nil]
MALNLEAVPAKPRKRDPAWKHCQVYKNGDNVHLVCIYCGKIFSGGGIHRVKEHLAGQKGNGSTCSRVAPDVRLAMQECLSAVVKSKKHKHGEELDTVDPSTSEIGSDQCGLNTEIELSPMCSQKRNPAWKHCRMCKDGDKVYLECIYCGKVFKGGGIYRVKEHLAGKKGNGSTCLRVQPDVRLAMQECWSKKHKHAEEIKTLGAGTSEIDVSSEQCGLNTEAEWSSISPQKRDPAWKHCQMYKDGDKVYLKCIYCGKVFKGGGIYRVKEHLAGQKGNGSTCLRVQPDVRVSMLERLNEVVTKSKKQKLADKINIDDATNQCWLNVEVESLQVPDTLEQNGSMFVSREEGKNSKLPGRKTGKIRNVSPSGDATLLARPSNQAVNSKRINNEVHMAIAWFLLDAGVPFEAVNSAYFQPMIDAIASQGVGVAGPSYHELRSWILNNSVQELKNEIGQCTGTWATTGCSVLVDEWETEKGKSFINFSVYCPERTIFLRSVDVSNTINSDGALFQLLKEVVEEVGVTNLLQVVTGCEDRYVDAGKRLTDAYPTIFWTPCASQCIDLMLEDIKRLEWVNVVLEQAKAISIFIYNHSFILNMMRRYTFGVDLVDLGATRSATDFLTIKRMVNMKHNLQSMVTSEEWMESPYTKKPKGSEVPDFISNQHFWSSCTLITRLTDPLLRLSRIVGSAKKPAMGYVYAALYRAKETIKKELIDKEYLVYWNIIDHRWRHLRRHPLHAAGFYLNPRFFYSTEEDVQHRIRSLVYDCVEKLVPDPNVQDKIVIETTAYKKAAGEFGRDMAVRARETLLPGEWWSAFGGGCPNLAQFATRILSQTCSLISGKPSRDLSEWINRTMNCLEHRRLNDLVLVRSNLRLRGEMNRTQSHMDPIAYENIALAGDWVSGRELFPGESGCTDWAVVDPPLGNGVLSGPEIDDAEALGSGFNDHEVLDF